MTALALILIAAGAALTAWAWIVRTAREWLVDNPEDIARERKESAG